MAQVVNITVSQLVRTRQKAPADAARACVSDDGPVIAAGRVAFLQRARGIRTPCDPHAEKVVPARRHGVDDDQAIGASKTPTSRRCRPCRRREGTECHVVGCHAAAGAAAPSGPSLAGPTCHFDSAGDLVIPQPGTDGQREEHETKTAGGLHRIGEALQLCAARP